MIFKWLPQPYGCLSRTATHTCNGRTRRAQPPASPPCSCCRLPVQQLTQRQTRRVQPPASSLCSCCWQCNPLPLVLAVRKVGGGIRVVGCGGASGRGRAGRRGQGVASWRRSCGRSRGRSRSSGCNQAALEMTVSGSRISCCSCVSVGGAGRHCSNHQDQGTR